MIFPIGTRVLLLHYSKIKYLILNKCGGWEFEISWGCGALLLDGKIVIQYVAHLMRPDHVLTGAVRIHLRHSKMKYLFLINYGSTEFPGVRPCRVFVLVEWGKITYLEYLILLDVISHRSDSLAFPYTSFHYFYFSFYITFMTSLC